MSVAARTFVAGLEGARPIWRKHPDAVEQVTVDFASVLHSDEELEVVTWTFPSGLVTGAPANTATTATCNVGTGTAGADYSVKLVVLTVGGYGRTIVWTCAVQVRDPVV